MNTVDSDQDKQANFVLECADLQSAQEFYMQEYGFRLEVIYPADDPRCVTLGGHGILIQLEQAGAAPGEPPEFQPAVVVQKKNDHSWSEGRAGMQYRDLIPDRLGGKYIASHIRIPVGGPVPDYVHHHHIQFQLIYCFKGWVRVVYEDQGEPIMMQAGDCVLQPPHIRHRVLECSDGMEVVEVSCPAEHETFVEHDMELPTNTLDVGREFGGQKFIFHRAEDCHWEIAQVPGFEIRDTGISQATKGIAAATILRAAHGTTSTAFSNDQEFYFNFVLAGSLELAIDNAQSQSLQEGDSFVIPPDCSLVMGKLSPNLEILQVTSPG